MTVTPSQGTDVCLDQRSRVQDGGDLAHPSQTPFPAAPQAQDSAIVPSPEATGAALPAGNPLTRHRGDKLGRGPSSPQQTAAAPSQAGRTCPVLAVNHPRPTLGKGCPGETWVASQQPQCVAFLLCWDPRLP